MKLYIRAGHFKSSDNRNSKVVNYLGLSDVGYLALGNVLDPVLLYKGYSCSIYDVQDALYDEYNEYLDEVGVSDTSGDGFDDWLSDNSYIFDELIECIA